MQKIKNKKKYYMTKNEVKTASTNLNTTKHEVNSEFLCALSHKY